MTVGPGFSPGLLTLPLGMSAVGKALAGLRANFGNWAAYRRWGLSPRP